MAENTGISWCRSTFNPWLGCTKIGPGCDGCYAEALDARKVFDGQTHWGPGVPRKRTSIHNWNDPVRWNRKAGLTGEHWLVFCASLADVFDNEVPDEWRADLWRLIEATPNLSWLLVTKRIGNVRGMVPISWFAGFPANVRLLITVCNQEEAARDIPKLLTLPCKNGISYEPALGPVDWHFWLKRPFQLDNEVHPSIDWIIVGGESDQVGHKARPFDIDWARSTINQCHGTPVFVKQLGSSIEVRNDSSGEWPDEDAFCDAIPDDYQPQYQGETVCIRLKDKSGADPAEWPENLRVREFPNG